MKNAWTSYRTYGRKNNHTNVEVIKRGCSFDIYRRRIEGIFFIIIVFSSNSATIEFHEDRCLYFIRFTLLNKADSIAFL